MDHLPNDRPGWWKSLIRVRDTLTGWLVEPSLKIQSPGRRRNARLVSFFLICLFLLFLSVNLGYLLTVPHYRFPSADLIGYGILTIAYILSRTRLTSVAVFILLVMFPLNVFQNIIGGTSLGVTAVNRGQLAHLWANWCMAREGLPRWKGGFQRGKGTL
jgi:hypothetical protein